MHLILFDYTAVCLISEDPSLRRGDSWSGLSRCFPRAVVSVGEEVLVALRGSEQLAVSAVFENRTHLLDGWERYTME